MLAGLLTVTDSRSVAYGGICSPSGTHHYHFKLYALDAIINMPASAGKANLLKAMEGHILGRINRVL